MQTLILTNPVVGPSRTDVPPADSALAELLNEAFADLLARVSEEQQPADWTGPLPVRLGLSTESNSIPFVRSEPIGAVQGLAEAAVMPADGGVGDLLILKAPPKVENDVVSADPAAKDHPLPADPFVLALATIAPSDLPASMPQSGAQSDAGHLEQLLPTLPFSDEKLSPKAGTNLPWVPLVDQGSPAIERSPAPLLPTRIGPVDTGFDLPSIARFGVPERPQNGSPVPEGAKAKVSGPEVPGVPDAVLWRIPGNDKLSISGSTVLEPLSAEPEPPAYGMQHLATSDVLVPIDDKPKLLPDLWQASSRLVITQAFPDQATDLILPRAEVLRAVAKGRTESDVGTATPQNSTPLDPMLAISAATRAAALWQAGLVAETEQNPPADPTNEDTPAPSDPRTPNPSAMLLRYEAQVAPTLRLARDFVFGPPAPLQPDDLGREKESGVALAAWPAPSLGSAVAGIGYPASSVSLQDLPRLAAQLAGTLVHRADGQTEVALSPEELGHVRLSMQADAQNPDRVVLMLTFERPETLDLFRRHADQLADALRAAGYSGADISFGSSGDQNSRDRPAPDRPASTQFDTAGETDNTPAHHPPRIAATGSLDLRL